MTSARSGSRTLDFPADCTILCLSHLRWNAVLQRPQSAIGRLAGEHRVLFWEEPVIDGEHEATLDVRTCAETGVIVITPRLPTGMTEEMWDPTLRTLLEIYLAGQHGPLVRWYLTPTMLPLTRHIEAVAIVYDGTDAQAGDGAASRRRRDLEDELLDTADFVLAGALASTGPARLLPTQAESPAAA